MVQNYSETNKMDCQWDENEQAELFITSVRGGLGGEGRVWSGGLHSLIFFILTLILKLKIIA